MEARLFRLLIANIAWRIRDWWFAPQKGDVPRWTLRQMLELANQDHDEAPPPRRPIW
jgi:hypothetical protein